MPFFEVAMERHQETTFWIEADTAEAAQEDAGALIMEDDWRDIWGYDYSTVERPSIPSTVRRYWSGGEQGHWVEPHSASNKVPS